MRRFVPSEFGFDESAMDVEHSPLQSLLDNKRRVRQAMIAGGVDWTVILVGASWSGSSTQPSSASTSTTTLSPPRGSRSAAITLTSLRDIGLLTATALLDDNTRNSVLRLGKPITYGEAADIVDLVHDSTAHSVRRSPMTRRVKSIDERQREVCANPANLPARFAILLAGQLGIAWPEEQTYSHQKSYQLKTFREAIEELANTHTSQLHSSDRYRVGMG